MSASGYCATRSARPCPPAPSRRPNSSRRRRWRAGLRARNCCEQATAVAQEARKTSRSLRELVLDKGLLTKDELQLILRPNFSPVRTSTPPRWVRSAADGGDEAQPRDR
ncbi:hypothetical protein [Streptomyces sp. NPDC000880]